MAAFLIMAIQAFLSVLEYYLIIAVAGVLVPWGLLPQTKFLAEKAIGAVVAAGIKLMVLAFIIAVASPVLATIHFSGPEIKLNELWSVILTTGAIAFLAWHAPSLAAGLLAGSPSLGASAVSQNLSSAAMLTAGVAGTMVSATRAAANGVVAAGGHAAYGAGVLAGGASKGRRKAAGPVGAVFGAGRGAGRAAGGLAIDGVKAGLGHVLAPFRDNFRAGSTARARPRTSPQAVISRRLGIRNRERALNGPSIPTRTAAAAVRRMKALPDGSTLRPLEDGVQPHHAIYDIFLGSAVYNHLACLAGGVPRTHRENGLLGDLQRVARVLLEETPELLVTMRSTMPLTSGQTSSSSLWLLNVGSGCLSETMAVSPSLTASPSMLTVRFFRNQCARAKASTVWTSAARKPMRCVPPSLFRMSFVKQ